MGNPVKPTHSGKSSIRGTHIMAALCFLLMLGSGGAAWWLSSSKKQVELPVLALNRLISDARMYQGAKGGFPDDLAQLQDVVWKKRGRSFVLSENNHSFTADNYYYLYAAAGPHLANIWAVPLGKYRENFPSFYVTIRTGDPAPTIWQGPALEHDQLSKMQGLMTDKGLIELGMKLQPSQPQPAQAQPAPFPLAR